MFILIYLVMYPLPGSPACRLTGIPAYPPSISLGIPTPHLLDLTGHVDQSPHKEEGVIASALGFALIPTTSPPYD